MLPESPIAGGDGSEEAVEVVEEEQDAGEVRFSQLEEVEKTGEFSTSIASELVFFEDASTDPIDPSRLLLPLPAIQQPPTPVNPPSISAQAKIPPPSPKKPLSSAASSSSFVKKKIPPPHLNLDPMNRQPNPSSSSSNHHPIEKPKSNKSSKPSSSSRSQAPAGPPAPPKKPLLSNTTTSSKLSKLSPPKGPSLDASLFGKGNGSDSELSEVSTIGPSQSQSQSQVRAPTSKRKRVGLLEASQEEEEDEESGRGSGKGKKKLKMEMETKKRKDRHRDSDESNDEEDDLDEDNDEEEEEEEGGGTSLAAPPTKQSVPKKTYGSSARKKSLPPPSHTKPNSNSKPKPNPPPKKATLVGSLKSESNVVASDLATSPFPSSSSSPPRPTHQHQHQHRHAGGMEMDEYDDLPSVPEGGKLNPITAARREPAPSKTPLKAKGIKGKGKGGMRGGGGGGKKMVGAGGKKEKEKKSKETISSDEEEEEEEGTKGGRTSRTLRNKLKSTLVVGREESGVGVGVEGGRRSARKRGDRASGKGVECVGREEEEGDEDMVSGEEEKVGGGGKGKGKEKGKRKKVSLVSLHERACQEMEEEAEVGTSETRDATELIRRRVFAFSLVSLRRNLLPLLINTLTMSRRRTKKKKKKKKSTPSPSTTTTRTSPTTTPPPPPQLETTSSSLPPTATPNPSLTRNLKPSLVERLSRLRTVKLRTRWTWLGTIRIRLDDREIMETWRWRWTKERRLYRCLVLCRRTRRCMLC